MIEQIPAKTINPVYKSVDEVNAFLNEMGIKAKVSLLEFSSIAREGGRLRNKKADVASTVIQNTRVVPYVFFKFCGKNRCIWYPDPAYFAKDVGVVMVVEVDCAAPQKMRAVLDALVELYDIQLPPGAEVAFQNICGIELYQPPEPAPPPPPPQEQPAVKQKVRPDKQKVEELASKLVNLANAFEIQPEQIVNALLKPQEAELGRAVVVDIVDIYGDDAEKLMKSDYISVVRAVLRDEGVFKVVQRMLASEAYRKVVLDLLNVSDEELAKL